MTTCTEITTKAVYSPNWPMVVGEVSLAVASVAVAIAVVAILIRLLLARRSDQ